MPTARPSRRGVLAVGTALVLTGPAALTGCSSSARAPSGPDPLESPTRRADADAALAHAMGQTEANPALASSARAFAADRMAHATALRAELRRARPGPPSTSTVPPPAGQAPAAPDPSAARTALTQAARGAQDEAAGLVVTLPGYRAALLASIAACCATHAALLS